MTTEPTVSPAFLNGTAFILLDMRTAAGSKDALGGIYPATPLCMPTDWVNAHKDTGQRLRLDADLDPGPLGRRHRRQDA